VTERVVRMHSSSTFAITADAAARVLRCGVAVVVYLVSLSRVCRVDALRSNQVVDFLVSLSRVCRVDALRASHIYYYC
jgi:hypothetical protein